MEITLGRRLGRTPGKKTHREEPSEVPHVVVTPLAAADELSPQPASAQPCAPRPCLRLAETASAPTELAAATRMQV
jgi:hypothetical protein